ncbi:MAG: AmmeMemoRadiSam system protein B [Candidatus Omnitrophica bacterium]|nr:AmmeMemoRadiSam system protein B [Candidatus Omnitrophota bacterium]
MVRETVVAGQFYPGSREALRRAVCELVDPNAKKEDAIGAISPHAGYIYSGSVAGSVFSAMKPKKRYVILGPNHTGLGEAFGLDKNDSWKTPLGNIGIDRVLAGAIMENCAYIKNDSLSHQHEHSIEVQLPFLQVLQKDFKIVPIVVSYADMSIYKKIGEAIAGAIKTMKLEKEVTIIASSDMTHYESHESVKKKDSIAIDAMLELDETKLVKKVLELDITMCGYAPAAIMITAAKELGAKHAKLVKYQTSGDTSGDYLSVVGYAGIIIS